MALNTFSVQHSIFTSAELDKIEQLGDQLVQKNATINAEKNNAAIRVTRVAWINPDPENQWLFARMSAVVQRINAQSFNFDIKGFEPFQYTVYETSEGGHYGWHVDCGPNNPVPRKISLSVQLSDPSSYTGCDLEFKFGSEPITASRARGAVIAFPSFFLHRVTPIESGTRKALVLWASGPEFR